MACPFFIKWDTRRRKDQDRRRWKPGQTACGWILSGSSDTGQGKEKVCQMKKFLTVKERETRSYQ